MYYTYKKRIVVFFLWLLIIITSHYYLSQKITVFQQKKLFLKQEPCLLEKLPYFYNPQQALIYKEISTFEKRTSTLLLNETRLPHFLTEVKSQKYLVYFITEQNKKNIYIETEAICSTKNMFFFLEMLPIISSPQMTVFANEENHYIRRDTSYICNEKLTKLLQNFSCHQDSYYIDLSQIV